MKLFALICVVGLALASAVPQTHEEEHYKSSDEIDEFIRSPDSPRPVKNVQEVVGQLRDHVTIDTEKLTDKAEKLFKKGSAVTGSIVDYMKSVSEKGKKKVMQLIYRGAEDGSSGERSALFDFNLREAYQKLKESIKSNLTVDELKAKFEQVFGKGSEYVVRILKAMKEQVEDVQRNVVHWIKRIIGEKKD